MQTTFTSKGNYNLKGREDYKKTYNMMVQPGTERRQEQKHGWQEGKKTRFEEKSFETFCLLTYMEQNQVMKTVMALPVYVTFISQQVASDLVT